MADRDDDDRSLGRAVLLQARLGKGAQQRERLEVDAGQAQPSLLTGCDIAVDQLAVRDDEQNPDDRVPLLVRAPAELLEVDDRLVEWDRQHFLRAEANGVLELLRVRDACDFEDPYTDAVVRDPEADALARKPVLAEERTELVGQQLRLAQLTADDQPRLEVLARDLHELRRAVVDDAGRRELRGTDLQADEALCPLVRGRPARLAFLLRARLLRCLRLLRLALERELALEERLAFLLRLRLRLGLCLGLRLRALALARQQVGQLDLLLQVHCLRPPRLAAPGWQLRAQEARSRRARAVRAAGRAGWSGRAPCRP